MESRKERLGLGRRREEERREGGKQLSSLILVCISASHLAASKTFY